jgi:protein-tyrosine phosphatase
MSSQAFEIFDLKGHKSGMVAICRQPHLDSDFQTVQDWNADVIVTMTTVDEFERDDFAAKISNSTPQWIQAAVTDFGVPENDLSEVISRLSGVLGNNGRVLIHCMGGKGRSGMLATRLLVEQGEEPENALNRIRNRRAGAVETKDQENWASNRT